MNSIRTFTSVKQTLIALTLLIFSSSGAYAQWSGTNPEYVDNDVKIGFSNSTTASNAPDYFHLNGYLRMQRNAGAYNLTHYSMNISNSSGGPNGLRISASTDDGSTFSDIMHIAETGQVAIGTMTPEADRLHVDGNGDAVMIERDESGTVFEPTKAKYGISTNSPTSGLRFQLSDDNGSTYNDALHLAGDGRVGIGTTDVQSGFQLSVCGNVRAKGMTINSGWCDYVFEDDYNLRSIEDLEAFIIENHHLPNIPPASEIETNGLDVATVQAGMMEKIEELTLYVIELKKEIEALKK